MKFYNYYEKFSTIFVVLVALISSLYYLISSYDWEMFSVQKNLAQENFQIELVHTKQACSSCIELIQDTVPKKVKRSRSVIHSTEDGSDMLLIIEDGQVAKLRIDGETIPKSEYRHYSGLISEEMNKLQPHPKPPKPPAPRKIYDSQNGNEFERLITEKLYRDRLISNPQRYSMSLTLARMRVNGKRIDDRLKKEYIEFIEEYKGEIVTKGSSYEIHVN